MALTLNSFLNGFELKEVQDSGDNSCNGMLKWYLEVPKIEIVDIIQGLLLPPIYICFWSPAHNGLSLILEVIPEYLFLTHKIVQQNFGGFCNLL